MPVETSINTIDLLAPPFRGHLHPVLAMARELKAAGHQVCVFSTASAEADIKVAEVPYKILTSIDDQALLQVVNPPWPIGHSPTKLKQQFHEVLAFFEQLTQELDDIYSQRNVDLLIADFTLVPVGLCAQRYGLKWWTSLPSPCVLETKDGPPAYLGGWMPATNNLSRLKNWVGRKLVRIFKRSIFYLYRKKIRLLGLANVYRNDGSEAIYSPDKILCLGDVSVEFPRRWPGAAQFIGPKLYSPALNNRKPQFVEGKRHILITIGTHLDWHKASVWEAVLSAAEVHTDCVFHFSGGGQDLERQYDLDNVIAYRYINYAAHIEHYDCVVHHGGAGIMYYCLQASIPAIVYPVDYDQFDHAARLEYYGYAVRLEQLEELSSVLAKVLADEGDVVGLSDCYPSLALIVSNVFILDTVRVDQ